MVWGAIPNYNRMDLVGRDGKMDSEYSFHVSESVLNPVAESFLWNDRFLQLDNAAGHTSQHTLKGLDVKDIEHTK